MDGNLDMHGNLVVSVAAPCCAEGQGKAEEVKGNLKQAGEKVKDAAKK